MAKYKILSNNHLVLENFSVGDIVVIEGEKGALVEDGYLELIDSKIKPISVKNVNELDNQKSEFLLETKKIIK